MPRMDSIRITKRKLFAPPPDSPHLVIVGAGDPDWYVYAYGYKTAADVLISRLNERGVVSERLCIPILFLYRHYVELIIKALLTDLGELSHAGEPPPHGHGLLSLWKKLEARILAYDPSQNSPWLERASALIEELDELDPGALSFRYPVAKDGKRMLPAGQSLDIRHFQSVMEELALVLDGAAAWLNEHIGLKHEMEHDYDGYNY